MAGILYIVPTPVGNLEDMTFRAIRVLKEADLILAEDTRTSSVLLKHYEIKGRLESHHKFNEHKTASMIKERILAGLNVALISDAQYRTEFSIKALTDAGKTVECLDSQVGNWDQTKGQELCANALTVHGYDVEVVFCNNDGMAMGALTAIQTAGRIVGEDIYLVGVDALPEAVEAIKLGDMTGTVLNDHIGQSHAAVDVAVQLLKGEEIQNYYWVNYVKVDKAYAEAQ